MSAQALRKIANDQSAHYTLGEKASILKSLGNVNRLNIIFTLYKGEKSVNVLANILGISQSLLSQHLAKLRRDDLVIARRDSQNVYYSLNAMHANNIISILRAL